MLTKRENQLFWRLQVARCAGVICLTLFLSSVVTFYTSESLLSISAVIGVLVAGNFLKYGTNLRKVVIRHIVVYCLLWVAIAVIDHMASTTIIRGLNDLDIYRISEHVFLIISIYTISLIATWFFWTVHHAITIECSIFGILLIWLLKGHRYYTLDNPKSIANIAWTLGVSLHIVILYIGVIAALLIGIYLAASSLRPLFGKQQPIRNHTTVTRIAYFIAPLIFLALLAGYASLLNISYSEELNKAMNGVGQATNKENDSPLGFHSSVSQTKQPAAVVRMERDYTQNPWAPMLYLREGALSKFNGKEFVQGNASMDTDVPRAPIGTQFNANITNTNIPLQTTDQNSTSQQNRIEITHSVYLLANHDAMFAIDFPISIRPIKNPNDDRFKAAYQALSYAPTLPIKGLTEAQVGDSTWSKQMVEHYLRAPGSLSQQSLDYENIDLTTPIPDEHGEDLRYKALALHLTANLDTPVLKAAAIVNYLSAQSIYTRSPKHDTTHGGDPVAPYLFANEKRGYCVHFAHAGAYLMRLSGIPARIATGYLTDLSYAKDGHILLHLGDRHAWPEVYVKDRGWIVFDISPAQAENEQAIVPDQKLLEDLMSKIDPTEELVTPITAKTNEYNNTDILLTFIKSQFFRWILLFIALTFVTLKILLRFGYKLVPHPITKTRLAYLAFHSTMIDLGVNREYGETKQEYSRRLNKTHNIEANNITLKNEIISYRQNTNITKKHTTDNSYNETHNKIEIHSDLNKTFASISKAFPIIKRALAFLNPSSIFNFWKS